jgi:hypothetical protein
MADPSTTCPRPVLLTENANDARCLVAGELSSQHTVIPFVHPRTAPISRYFEFGDLTAGPLLLPGVPGTLDASCPAVPVG